jgi:heat shock protein HslJ
MRKLFVAVLRAAVPAAFAFVLLAGVAAAAPGLPPQVVGPEWRLVSYQGADGQTTDVSANGITIRFSADGTVSGSGGCNAFRGTYTADTNGALTVSQVVATLRACLDENKTNWETRYFAALQTVSAYKLDGDWVQLVFAGGGGLLTFAPVQPASGGTLPGMPVTGAGTPPSWPAALGALLMALGGLALRAFAVWPASPPAPPRSGKGSH